MRHQMLYFLALLVAMLSSLGMPFSYPQAGGMDPSWHQALVEATDQGRVFGQDVVFTYGPFHQLFTRQASTNLTPLLAGRLISATGWAAVTVLVGRKLGLGAALAIVSATLIPWSSDNYRISEFFYPLLAILTVMASMTGRLQRVLGYRVDLVLLTQQHHSALENPVAIRLSTIGFSQPFRALRFRFGRTPRPNAVTTSSPLWKRGAIPSRSNPSLTPPQRHAV